MRVAFFPNRSTPYVSLLASALEQSGVEIVATSKLTFQWLFSRGRVTDVVHLHWLQGYTDDRNLVKSWLKFAYFAAWLILARYLLGIRIVWTVHNLYPHEVRNSWTVRWARILVCKLSSGFVIHSESVRDLVAQEFHLRPECLHVMEHPNWIGVYPNSVSKDRARDLLGLPRTSKVLLALGHVRPYKGIPWLLKEFVKIQGDVHLVVAGHVDDPKLRKEIEGNALDKRVHSFLRFVPDEELQVYLNACDALVLPFRDVLTSGSAILGMSFQRPVIAPALGCLPQLLREGAGILYNPDQEHALEGSMRQAIACDLEAMGQTAYAKVLPLTWERFGAQHVTLYRAILVPQSV